MLLLVAILVSIFALSQETRLLSVDKPQAIADLKTKEGAASVNARWFVQPAHLREKQFNLPGPQRGGGDALLLYPTGALTKTNLLHDSIAQDN